MSNQRQRKCRYCNIFWRQEKVDDHCRMPFLLFSLYFQNDVGLTSSLRAKSSIPTSGRGKVPFDALFWFVSFPVASVPPIGNYSNWQKLNLTLWRCHAPFSAPSFYGALNAVQNGQIPLMDLSACFKLGRIILQWRMACSNGRNLERTLCSNPSSSSSKLKPSSLFSSLMLFGVERSFLRAPS